MNVNDYLLDLVDKDWNLLLQAWTPPLPGNFSLWLVNRLGEVIFVTPDGSVHWLEVGRSRVVQVANSREHFAGLLDSGDNANQWLRISLVNACRSAGVQLANGECYGFKIPPALQGGYEPENLQPTRLELHYSLLAYLTKQEEIYWSGG